MRKGLSFLIVVAFVFMMSHCAFAQEAAAGSDAALNDIMKNQAMVKAKDQLQSQEWNVYVYPVEYGTGKRLRGGTENDVFKFAEGKVSSKNMVAKGYPESNFSLTIQDGGLVVWETMQVNEGVGLAFIRGELGDTGLKGVISFQPVKGEKSSYAFSTVMPTAAVEASQAAVTKKKSKK